MVASEPPARTSTAVNPLGSREPMVFAFACSTIAVWLLAPLKFFFTLGMRPNRIAPKIAVVLKHTIYRARPDHASNVSPPASSPPRKRASRPPHASIDAPCSPWIRWTNPRAR